MGMPFGYLSAQPLLTTLIKKFFCKYKTITIKYLKLLNKICIWAINTGQIVGEFIQANPLTDLKKQKPYDYSSGI